MANITNIALNGVEYSVGDDSTNLLSTAFDVSPVLLEGNTSLNRFIKVQDNLVYYQYPYPRSVSSSNASVGGVIRFYDANFNRVTHTEKTGGSEIKYAWNADTRTTDASLMQDCQQKFWFDGDTFYANGVYQGDASLKFAEQPAYFTIWYDNKYSVGNTFPDEISDDSVYLNVNDKAVGFWEQVQSEITDSYDGSELGKKITDSSIRNANRLRQAFRFATWNIYGASKHQSNWTAVKNALQNCGIDMIGFQEVYNPLGDGSAKVFADEVGSWHLSEFSNVTSYPNSSRVVASTNEFEYIGATDTIYTTQANYGNRYYCRAEFRLPRWKGKNWSDHIKVSVYNTQLEVGSSTAYTNARLAQAQQLVTAMQNDPNPFIVLVGDFNEMATDRSTFKLISDAGFTPVLADTSTPTSYRGFYDNIFVNNRISIVNNAMIPYSDNGTNISDHNLLMADLVFDYTNIIAVKKTGSNCTIGVEDWLDRTITEAVTINITADSGYTISSITVGQGDNDLTYTNGAISKSGNTITVYPNLVVGDMWISVTTTANA